MTDAPRAGDASPSDRRHHASYLALAVGVLAAALLLDVTGPDTVALRALGRELPLPPSCLLRSWGGVSCPGCGLTRGVVSLAHGDLAASLAFHPLSPLFVLLLAWQVPYRAAMLRAGRAAAPAPLLAFHRWAGHATIAALVAVWLARVVMGVEPP